MKKKTKINTAVTMTADELIAKIVTGSRISTSLKFLVLIGMVIPVIAVFSMLFPAKSGSIIDDDLISMAPAPINATTAKRDTISIPTGIAKQNPFVPYRNIDSDELQDIPKFDLVAPPEVLNEGSDAARVMDTIVSGILYDRFSPSAILNIEGNDYLVKKGDVVNNYKIVNIEQNSVTVKLGGNTFKAGIGEILTEGTVNYNDVSNLSKKFGGEKR